MVLAGKLHLHNAHFYWPEFDYLRPAKERRAYRRRLIEPDDSALERALGT